MSDFVNSGWSLYVAGLTVVSMIGCLVLLAIASKRKVMANDNTTGHVWDEDLREMNNPLPRWWVWLFIITVAFSAVYLVLYPGLGSFGGTLKWSSVGQYDAEVDKARAAMAPLYAKYTAQPADALAKDPQAMAIGERLFANNCATCHGADARGSKGFPNLTDRDWLGGDGSPAYIEKTIKEGRQGVMPPMAAAVGSADDVRNVANYVLSLAGSPNNAVAAQLGKAKFAACAACHGADGKGNPALGAPNLTDKVWLHGWGEDAIVSIIGSGKTNTMPAQASRLSDEQIHVLGAYVWNLSQSATVAAK
ncbi:MAG: cytochrome-c oxidase, cbb3-type subunit III [Proteobacteria bacterium]|nr:cytochrome-c oxidase, cbb3-type subunit III [Pseudomonadota bacterium]